MCLRCSPRTYYRKQCRLAARVNALFLRAGMTQAWFDRELAPVPYIASALRSLRSRPGALVDKRAGRELNIAQAKPPREERDYASKNSSASSAAGLRALTGRNKKYSPPSATTASAQASTMPAAPPSPAGCAVSGTSVSVCSVLGT